jgi:hypothetical protein
METKFYECNNELAGVLHMNGLVETTDHIDQQKGKKEFRNGPQRSRMIFRFDYINFIVFENGQGCNFRSDKISAEDLKMLLWYNNSSAGDKEHISDGHFDQDRVRQNVQTMTSLLGYAKEFNSRSAESKRFERLLSKLAMVKLN